MALLKEKQLPNGTSGDYWKITQLSVDKEKLKLNVTISLYVSKQVSDAGSPNLNVRHHFQGSFTKEQLAGDLTALGYQLIKDSVAGGEPTNILKPLAIKAHRDLHLADDA